MKYLGMFLLMVSPLFGDADRSGWAYDEIKFKVSKNCLIRIIDGQEMEVPHKTTKGKLILCTVGDVKIKTKEGYYSFKIIEQF